MTTAANESKSGAGLGAEQLLRMYTQMVRIRLFEEQVNDLYMRAVMPGLAHLYIGEEAVAVGICEALRPRRLHHQHASRPRALPGQGRHAGPHVRRAAWQGSGLLPRQGRIDAHCRPGQRQPGANAIVGGSAGMATGAAFSAKMRGTKQVAVCFFGEGALGQGLLYEVMNLSQLWNLPVIYVCENNMYNEYTHFSETTAGDILGRPAAFGIPAEAVDGQDVRAVYAAASRVVDRARAGKGPAFLLCNTYRYRGHHVGDVNREYYRAKQEENTWLTNRDPIKLLGDWMISEKLADQLKLDKIQAEVKAEMEAAVAFAQGPLSGRGTGRGGRLCLR